MKNAKINKKLFVEQTDKVAEALRDYMYSCGIRNEEVLENTPKRWLKFLHDFTIGVREPYKDFKVFSSEYNQMVVVETSFHSLCEHHLLPYFGKIYLAYLPKKKVVGVSKIVKMITHLSKKPSIQEGLTEEISKLFSQEVDTAGTAVVIQAMHTCVATRYKEGYMLTSSMQGLFKQNPYVKQEFMSFVNNRLEKS